MSAASKRWRQELRQAQDDLVAVEIERDAPVSIVTTRAPSISSPSWTVTPLIIASRLSEAYVIP